MKKKSGYFSDYSLYEHLRQQLNMIPAINSLPVKCAAEQSSFKMAHYTLHPALIQQDRKDLPLSTDSDNESVFTQTVKGIVRSFVFINWKDHA